MNDDAVNIGTDVVPMRVRERQNRAATVVWLAQTVYPYWPLFSFPAEDESLSVLASKCPVCGCNRLFDSSACLNCKGLG